jgi:hypothetical protein
MVGVACGEGSSASSSTRDAVRGLAQKSHAVAVAYRSFGAAQQDCVDKFNAGVLTTDEQGTACIDDGLTASHLEASIERLRRQVVSIEHAGSADCTAVAGRMATIVQREEDAIHTLHQDLTNLDARAFTRDFKDADSQALREADLLDPLLHACT